MNLQLSLFKIVTGKMQVEVYLEKIVKISYKLIE